MTRDWTDANRKRLEGRCRSCKRTERQLRADHLTLELAHTLGRTYDARRANHTLYVHPDSVVPLCGPATTTSSCHGRFDGHLLDLWPFLTEAERQWAIARVGEGRARRRISGRNWMEAP